MKSLSRLNWLPSKSNRFYPSIRRYAGGTTAYGERLSIHSFLATSLSAWETPTVFPSIQTTGVVYIVGNRTSPLPLHDHEVQALIVGAQRGSLMPHSFPCKGEKVCITSGPFQGVTGYVQRARGRFDTRDHHSVDPEIFCDSCENHRPRISQLGFRASAPPRRRRRPIAEMYTKRPVTTRLFLEKARLRYVPRPA